jgi:hypothetical protein
VDDVEGSRPSASRHRALALAAIVDEDSDGSLAGLAGDLQRICRAASRVLGLRGAAFHLVSGEGAPTLVCATDAWSIAVAEASFDSGEGPSIDAHALARPVLAPYLWEEGATPWPGYLERVRGSGLQACFALPLHVGAVRLGVLDLYSEQAGRLDAERTSLALTFAAIAVERLLDAVNDGGAAGLDRRLLDALERRSEIHQAQGMVMVDRDVDLVTALTLLRAHAFARGVPLLVLARELLAGAHLPDDEGPSTAGVER